MEIFMKKSKKILVTSLATATLGLISFADTTGAFPFSAQHVSAQEKDASKNGKVIKENTTSAPNQAEKPKTPAQKSAEKPKTPAQKSSEKPKTPAQKSAEKPKIPAEKPAEKSKTPAKNPAEKPKNPTPKEDKSKSSAQSGWVGSSYYQDGKKVTSKWIFDKKANSYFYLNASGNYAQNAWVGNYYLKSDGKMAKSEWIYDKNYGSYYYLTAEGSYARNTWVGNYYLKSDGKMAKAEWVYDKNYDSYYYLTAEGSYARNKWVGNYYLKSNGKMAKNEWIYHTDSLSYYYLTSEGSYARNTWVGNYYLKSDGRMAKSQWVDGGRYYVDPNGLWLPKSTDGNPYTAALNEAKTYNRNHYSKQRIYKLLILFGFNSDVAQYTIDHLYADYKANALATARNYRKYTNLSKTEIHERLLSSSYFTGEFTKEEANYAIQHLDD